MTISGSGFVLEPQLPEVRLGGVKATVAHASPQSLTVIVPAGLDGGPTPVRVDGAPGETAYVEIGAPIATGVHQVDNPAFDREGNLYVTFSGSRGQEAPVSIYVVRRDGSREPFVVGLSNPTSMAVDPAGPVARVEPFRRQCPPRRRRRIGDDSGDGSGRRVRDRLQSCR